MVVTDTLFVTEYADHISILQSRVHWEKKFLISAV